MKARNARKKIRTHKARKNLMARKARKKNESTFGMARKKMRARPVDTRSCFNVDTTRYRRWNDVVCLQGHMKEDM